MLNLFAIGRGILQKSAAREARRRRSARREFRPAVPPEARLESREMQSTAFLFTGGSHPLAKAAVWTGTTPNFYSFPTGASLSSTTNGGGSGQAWTYNETTQTTSTIANSQNIGGATTKIGTYVSIINTDDITNNGTSVNLPPPSIQANTFNTSAAGGGQLDPPSPTDYTWDISDTANPSNPGFSSVAMHFHFNGSLAVTGFESTNPRALNAFQSQVTMNYASTFFNVTVNPDGPTSTSTGFTVTPVNVAGSTSSLLPSVFIPWGGSYDVDFTVTTDPNDPPLQIGSGFNVGLRTAGASASGFQPGQHLHSATLGMVAEYSFN